MLKNRSILYRTRDGLLGIAEGWHRERSVRTHLLLTSAGLIILIVASARSHWVVAYLLLAALGLAAELFNGAIEAALDRLHPEMNSDIGAAKDMSSAAAMIINIAAISVFILALVQS